MTFPVQYNIGPIYVIMKSCVCKLIFIRMIYFLSDTKCAWFGSFKLFFNETIVRVYIFWKIFWYIEVNFKIIYINYLTRQMYIFL